MSTVQITKREQITEAIEWVEATGYQLTEALSNPQRYSTTAASLAHRNALRVARLVIEAAAAAGKAPKTVTKASAELTEWAHDYGMDLYHLISSEDLATEVSSFSAADQAAMLDGYWTAFDIYEF